MARIVPLAALLLGGLALVAAPARSADFDLEPTGVGDAPRDAPRFVPNEVLVKFRPGTADADRTRARGRASATLAEVVTTSPMRQQGDGELELLRLPPGLSVASAIDRLQGHFAVEYAEPNWIYRPDAVSTDTYYTNGSLWGMYGDATTPVNRFGSQAGEAWALNRNKCGSVWVGVIDEGYMYRHEDLAANAGKNPGEIAGNGIDDDGNGYRDDVYGWDFAGNNKSVFDGVRDDHGTHVAGTIGAVGGNGKGVVGICWSVKLLNAKFLGDSGGTTANAVRAVDYFTDLKKRHGLNLVATNNSWGGGGYSQSLYDAIQRSNAAGILFVAAAGNGGFDGIADDNDVVPTYPASYTNPNVIAVTAIAATGARPTFANYGIRSVDLGAPGVGVWSTVPRQTATGVASGYASYSGTSMAAPHVTGAAALYAAMHPGASAATIKSAILSRVVKTPSLSGVCVTGGRLNVSGF